MMDKELYSISEVAKMKGKTRQAVHQWIIKHRVPIIKVGAYRAIKKEDLDRIPFKE